MTSPRTTRLAFPPSFLWGVSTSAYQFEGPNPHSTWADWERRGNIRTGDTLGLAADWWSNAERDFDLAKQMSLNALRLSVDWARVEPREGSFDESALDRYRAMIDGLVARGIRPFVCLHHFNEPMWFAREGSFESRRSVERFARFAERVGRALSGSCRDFLTFNEPNVFAVQGWLFGEFPPGRRDLVATSKVFENVALAHAAAYRALKAIDRDLSVGITQHLITFAPANPASRRDRAVAATYDAVFNDVFLGSVVNGEVPWFVRPFSRVAEQVRGTTDWIGLNIYGRLHIAFDPTRPTELFGRRVVPADVPQGDLGMGAPFGECHPQGLGTLTRRFARFDKPLYILENGVPDRHDRIRPWLVAHAAREIHGLLAEGIDLRGYFHWSLVDNFEWAEGWGMRFGLCELDPVSQKRHLRASGRLYGAIAHHHALRAEDVARHAPMAVEAIFPGFQLASAETGPSAKGDTI